MKILALTSIRSDYDLLSPLYKLLHQDKNIDFKLLVSGAHLSKEFGYSKQQIVDDGFNILIEIETLINSDTSKSRLKTASLLLQNSIDIIDNFHPDILLFAGDREDVIIGALIGMYLNIPTIHFYGGDHEEDGHQDTYIRHATSKLSSLHFTSNKEHSKRLIALGESKNRIFDIGSISLDKFKNFNILQLDDFFEKKIEDKFALLIFHPIANESTENIFQNILTILEKKKIFTFVSYPNSDPGYKGINNIIEKYKSHVNFLFYKNLDRDLFLSILSKCMFIIGNSSAGIYEAGTIKKAVINVGLRQKNRLIANNIIYSEGDENSISSSIEKISSHAFKNLLTDTVNPYGDGNSAIKAYNLIKTLKFKNYLIKSEDPLDKGN